MMILYLLAGLIGAGLIYQAFGQFFDTRRFPPPGRVIDIGPFALHLHEQGSGRPVAILESGIASTSLAWALVQPRIAEFTRVVSYDRAGLGWSGECKRARKVEQMASDLATLL